MESLKKILPYIAIAIIFAVGGFFIGKGYSSNQAASLFKAGIPVQQTALMNSTVSNPTLAEGTSITTFPGTTLAECASLASLVGSNYWYDGVNSKCHLYNSIGTNPVTWSSMINKATCTALGGVWQKNKTLGKMECVLSANGNSKANNIQ